MSCNDATTWVEHWGQKKSKPEIHDNGRRPTGLDTGWMAVSRMIHGKPPTQVLHCTALHCTANLHILYLPTYTY